MIIILRIIVAYIAIYYSGIAAFEISTSADDLVQKFHQNDYKLEFERVEEVSHNKRYIKTCNIVTFKYNRTSPVVNVTWEFVMDVGYNHNMVFQAYKFASNEYRLFPMRFQLNFCDSIKENVVGFQSLTHCGNFTGCPFIKNKVFRICNWSPNKKHFPPFVPNGRYMMEIQGLFRTEEMYLGRAYFIIYRPILKK